ncbi:MAG: hypothetical protein QOD63_651 [Actinomycetota bacterium]|nr:hypothetical protein [Actinomycetota bacterium]
MTATRSFSARPLSSRAQQAPLPLATPAPRPVPRPPLRVVAPPGPGAKARRISHAVVVLLGVLAVAGLFAIVGLRVLLAQGQAPVDALEAKVATGQAEHQRLRLELAGLESPSRIVGEAQRRMGMAPPPVVVYLPPVPAGG